MFNVSTWNKTGLFATCDIDNNFTKKGHSNVIKTNLLVITLNIHYCVFKLRNVMNVQHVTKIHTFICSNRACNNSYAI